MGVLWSTLETITVYLFHSLTLLLFCDFFWDACDPHLWSVLDVYELEMTRKVSTRCLKFHHQKFHFVSKAEVVIVLGVPAVMSHSSPPRVNGNPLRPIPSQPAAVSPSWRDRAFRESGTLPRKSGLGGESAGVGREPWPRGRWEVVRKCRGDRYGRAPCQPPLPTCPSMPLSLPPPSPLGPRALCFFLGPSPRPAITRSGFPGSSWN